MVPFNISSPIQQDPDMTSTAQENVEEQNQQTLPNKPEASADDKKRWTDFRSRLDVCKLYRRKLIANWTISIDYRRGKPFTSQTDEDQIAVNLDWSLTKAKQASLFSQVPQVRVDHPPETLSAPWVKTFEQRLNDNLVTAGIESAMDECLPDCINAAGIGVVLVTYEAITEDKQVPKMDMSTLPSDLHSQVLQSGQFNGQPVEMDTVPQVVDKRYVVTRISPADLLWPINFTGANFDNAPWIGRSGRLTWADAVQKFNLKEEDKETVLGEDRPQLDKLTHDVERDKVAADEMVGFDELFYREYQYDSEAKSFSAIHHLVFVSGKDDPVIDEPWKGQRSDPAQDGQTGVMIVGAKKFPIRVLTLSYITDETIPPSDSAIGRPQVNEINRSRTQMIRQRERSLPVRTVDINRVDPAVMQSLMRGTWQQFIPIQGDGSRVINEVSRAQMPTENFQFDRIAKSDLNEAWTIGPNQAGSGADVNTATEAKDIESNFQTRVNRERAKVAAFVVGVAEILGSLMCLYEDPSVFGQGFDPTISTILSYSILADSTIVVDSNQRLQRLDNFINKYAKSGWINIEPVLQEIASLTGLDPATVVKAPDPKPPIEPNISLRLTGVEDLLNPLVLAILIGAGQGPKPELIEQAKQLIQQAVVPPQTPGQGGAPPLGSPTPPPQPPLPGDANPQMSAMPQVNDRSVSGGKQ